MAWGPRTATQGAQWHFLHYNTVSESNHGDCTYAYLSDAYRPQGQEKPKGRLHECFALFHKDGVVHYVSTLKQIEALE